jgi:pimeloyl-ACP methyl ester carboxylesterase
MSEPANLFDATIVEQKASKVGPAGIDIAYQRFGNPDAPVVLLIMGIAAQSINWPDAFCHGLAGRGLQVIRFDNRDSGLSTHMTDAPPPDLTATLAGDLSSVSYTLSDMAADALSTTGNMSVGQPSPDALREVFGGPRASTRDEVIQQMLRASRAVGSPGYPADEKEVATQAGRAYDRSHDPIGVARQAIATVASGDRTARLRHLTVPTLVIHGLADRMCDASGGRATAAAIPGAELVLIEGMGHNLPPGLRSPMAERIAAFVWRAEGR